MSSWGAVGLGVLFSLLGGGLVVMAFSTDTPGLTYLGAAVGGLGSLALFVGLIAVAVELGIRSARR